MDVPVSPAISNSIDEAVALSVRREQFYVGVEHLYEVLVTRPGQLPPAFVARYGETLSRVLQQVQQRRWRGRPAYTGTDVFYTPRCANAAKEANRLAERLHSAAPGPGHLLLAILADAHALPSRLMDLLHEPRGQVIEALRQSLVEGGGHDTTVSESRHEAQPEQRRPAAQVSQREGGERSREAVDEAPYAESRRRGQPRLTRDLTEAARRGRLQPAIGRDRETMQVLEVLSRKGKNNAILVGAAGVGKTQIVENLALAGAKGAFKDLLPSFRILELNMAALTAGTQYRGAFEEKVMALIDDLRNSPDAVLFIDEIHLIMGSGQTEGSGMDFANMLKPPLARGEIRCIGATTLEEYRRFIERDPALERRFQMVRVEPLSDAATYAVLKALRPQLERHHGVTISKRALKASIALTERYLPRRQLPDKAIDVVDQACARHRMRTVAARTKPGLFDSDPTPPAEEVTPHDVRKVVGHLAGVPVEEITAEERARISGLDAELSRRIVGQDRAVQRVAAAVKRARAGLADPDRPESVMLFVGPTGVGKTQLAKELAEIVFGSRSHLITFDMSEYVEAHSVARLIGAPPGYVGHEEEGRLTGAVRERPFSIFLFDEIEKAHPRVYDVLLPVLEEGRLKDSGGKDVSFRSCIMIFTSNLGAKTLQTGKDVETAALLQELQRHFRPEFLNRIDEVVPFYPLLFEDIRNMLKLTIRELSSRVRHQGYRLKVYQGAYELLAREGYSREFGARELRRVVDRRVIQPISTRILDGAFRKGDVIEVLVDDQGGLIFRKQAERSAGAP